MHAPHEHTAAPATAEAVPGTQPQAAHELADEAPCAALNVPLVQAVQPVVPKERLLYAPAAHAVHTLAPVWLLYMPAMHAVHTPAPVGSAE